MQTKTMSTLHYLHKYSILKYIQTHTNIYIYINKGKLEGCQKMWWTRDSVCTIITCKHVLQRIRFVHPLAHTNTKVYLLQYIYVY